MSLSFKRLKHDVSITRASYIPSLDHLCLQGITQCADFHHRRNQSSQTNRNDKTEIGVGEHPVRNHGTRKTTLQPHREAELPSYRISPTGKASIPASSQRCRSQREAEIGSYHLTDANLDFFLVLPSEPAMDAPEPLEDADNADITECISWLSTAPGVSELSAVSYIGDDDIWTRFSLNTTWITAQGKTAEVEKWFELSSSHWHLLQIYVDPDSKESWISLMNDLMMGSSDRAILHRRLHLDDYDEGFADYDESLWTIGWDEMPEFTPNQLLADHLEIMSYEEGVGAAYAPVTSLHLYADSEVLTVRLPCDHESVISAGIIKGLSKEDCLTARCATQSCRRKIMDKEDEQVLALVTRKEERAAWAIERVDWERRDHEVRNGSTATDITGTQLYQALKLALASMKAPESATPTALDPTAFLETKIVKRHFRQILRSVPAIQWPPRTVLIELQQ